MQRPGNDPALEYGPVRTTKLTEAMRKSLDNLDFGRPRHDTPQKPSDHAANDAFECELLHDTYLRRKFEGCATCHVSDDVFMTTVKKAGRKEINIKKLNNDRLDELVNAKAKEWAKMIDSGAVKVHVGEAARRLVETHGGKRSLESRYVNTTSDGKDTGPLKARWCIRGYLDPDIFDLVTAAPTLSPEGFATAVQMITSKKWKMKIADIEAAFLRGDDMKRTQGKVLVKVPSDGIPGIDSESVIELTKPVYGLADAPRLWWKSLTKTLGELGMRQSKLDSCVFHYWDPETNVLDGIIAFHVDDLIIGGSEKFYNDVFGELQSKYPFKHVKNKQGEFLGKQLV